jgi:diguanylate cyclase (GGDEF)-like protein/PAS domain S-box-containing protein
MGPMASNSRDIPIILENIPAALFRGFSDGSVELLDRKAEAMTGYTKEEFDSRQLKWVDLIHEEDRAQVRQIFLEALKNDKSYTREYRILAKDKRMAWVHERGQIICDLEGQIEYVIGLFFDITERKALEENLRRTERDFRIVVDNIPAVTFKGYLDGTVDLFDQKIEALTGYPPEAFGPQGIHWTGLILEEDQRSARVAFIEALRTNHTYVREYRLKAADGRTIWIHERSCIICDAAGRIEYVSGLLFDISARKELEATVAEKTAELQQANERLLLWGKELEHRNTEINPLGQMGDLLQCCHTTQEAHTGFQAFGRQLFPEDSGALFVFGESPNLLEAVAVWGEDPPKEQVFSSADCWAMRRGRVHGRADVESGLRCKHVQGGQKGLVCIPMMAHGTSLGMLHLQLSSHDPGRWDARQRLGQEVAEHLGLALAKLKLQETLQQQSIRDPLTGLFNRRHLEESLAKEVQKAQRQSHSLGLLMVDLDHFKLVNDSHGHEAGDAVLREMGKIFTRHIRSGDIACRFGGEEFTILLPDASLDIVRKRAEQIREAAKATQVRVGDHTLAPVTLSIGVAFFPYDGTNPDDLLQAADSALYRAKKEGRDRVCLADERGFPLHP